MAPSPIIDMDIWAEQNFHLPKQSYIPGLINLSLTPYNRQIMKDLSLSSPVRKVVYICGNQVAKSTIIFCALGYRVYCSIYGDMLFYFPDDGMAEKWSKTKLTDHIRANKFLMEALEAGRKSDDNVTYKRFLIGSLLIKGGKSGSKYRMDTGNFIVADDFADFPLNVGATTSGKYDDRKMGEGAPDKLLEDRGSGTGESSKIFINSSPKSENECPAWRVYGLTDKHHYFIECPRCGHRQAWEFENIVIKHKDYSLTEEPYILCQNTDCQTVYTGPGFKPDKSPKVYQDDKYKLMQNGIWMPTAISADPLTKGYRLPSVYSLIGYPLSTMSQDWLDACRVYDETGDEAAKIRHRNAKQARPWKRRAGKSVSHSALYNTRENLDPLPENCIILGCGFDVQKSGRIEGQVGGYGPNEKYIIEHKIFGGDPTIKPGLDGSPWNDVARFIREKTYTNVWGQEQPIYCVGIDIGFGKEEAWVKHFVKNFEGLPFQKIFAVYGKETRTGTINWLPAKPTRDVDGFESWGMYVNIQKVAIRNLLEKHVNERSKSNIHIGDKPCFTEQWCKQLIVEEFNEKGVLVKRHEHAPNEAQDCWYIRDAAFELAFKDFELGVDWESFKVWNQKEKAQFKKPAIAIHGSIF